MSRRHARSSGSSGPGVRVAEGVHPAQTQGGEWLNSGQMVCVVEGVHTGSSDRGVRARDPGWVRVLEARGSEGVPRVTQGVCVAQGDSQAHYVWSCADTWLSGRTQSGAGGVCPCDMSHTP